MANVLILGALSDVAQALAHEYASKKHSVMLAARQSERLSSIVSDLEIRYGIKAYSLEFDACAFESHVAFYDALPVSPDVVICVFGYLGDTEKGLHDWAEAKKILDVNYVGAVSILNVAASSMIKQNIQGTIIGISSVAGERGRQSNFLYGSAKAGFTAYLSGLRNKLFHHGIHVLTVKPGFIKTAMTEGMPLNPKLTASTQQVAKAIYRAAEKKKNVLYVLWMWKYIMCIIRNIPEGMFKKMKL